MIYLDHHAATPPHPSVPEAMRAAEEEGWANASSVHALGRRARGILEDARRRVAAALSAEPADLVFTSGGTESCNAGLRGILGRRDRIITTEVEHPAVSEPLESLERLGVEVVRLPVREGKPPDPDALVARVDERTVVAIQWINHETGTLFPVESYARAIRDKGGRLFVDASQALGKHPMELSALGASAVAFGAQKMGGPAGVGLLHLERGAGFDPLLLGGGQERGRRGGSENVAGAVGFAAACDHLSGRLESQPAIARRRDRLEAHLRSLGGTPNAANGPRVATATNVSFAGCRSDVLVAALDVEGLCASAGAACSSGQARESPVIAAMYPEERWRAASALRLSLGPSTTDAEVEEACAILSAVVPRARGSQPL